MRKSSNKKHKPRPRNPGRKRKKDKRPIVGVCNASGKLQFETQAKAKKELKRYQGDRHPRSVYLCPSCGKWHLTKQRPKSKRTN